MSLLLLCIIKHTGVITMGQVKCICRVKDLYSQNMRQSAEYIKSVFDEIIRKTDFDKVSKYEHLQPCWNYVGTPNSCKNCPAFTLKKGYSCWLVAGTLSGLDTTGKKAKVLDSCKQCKFYQLIKKQM